LKSDWLTGTATACDYYRLLGIVSTGKFYNNYYFKMNKVDYILKSSLSHQDRLEIKKLQRPTPDLQIEDVSTSKKRTFHRHFNRNIYDKYSWICGCEIRNKLFCFVCLVMGYGESSPWTKSGVSNLKHLADRLKKHTEMKRTCTIF
jgi:hypothetical protein